MDHPITTPKNIPHKPSVTIDPLGDANKASIEVAKKALSHTTVAETPHTLPTVPANTESDLPSLRTYKRDIAEEMKKEKTSLVKIVLEEQRAKQKKKDSESPAKTKNFIAIVISVSLFAVSLGLLYFIFIRTSPTEDEKTLQILDVRPIVFVEQNKEIVLDPAAADNLAREAILRRIQSDKFTLDTLEYIFFTEKLHLQTKDGIVEQKEIVSSEKFFTFINLSMPSLLLRALNEEFMFGLHSFNGNEPFFVLTTNYYDNTFAGMLEWEKRMPEALLTFFGEPQLAKELQGKKFQDMVVKNKDIRGITDSQGNIALVYAFKDEHTLIITTSEDTLAEIARRLDLSRGKK